MRGKTKRLLKLTEMTDYEELEFLKKTLKGYNKANEALEAENKRLMTENLSLKAKLTGNAISVKVTELRASLSISERRRVKLSDTISKIRYCLAMSIGMNDKIKYIKTYLHDSDGITQNSDSIYRKREN